MRPTEEGFEQVLRELKAGLRRSSQQTVMRNNKIYIQAE